MFSGLPPKADMAARFMSTRPNLKRGAATVRAISISYVDADRAEHRDNNP
jgi:hypothetical protein